MLAFVVAIRTPLDSSRQSAASRQVMAVAARSRKAHVADKEGTLMSSRRRLKTFDYDLLEEQQRSPRIDASSAGTAEGPVAARTRSAWCFEPLESREMLTLIPVSWTGAGGNS